jgi:hypothetical protein
MPFKPASVAFADTISELMKGVAGWLLVGLGVAAFLAGTGGVVRQAGTAGMFVPLLVIVFAVLFVISGVFVNPRFRRRLDRWHGLSQFGRIRTVENRTRSAAQERRESCVVCGSSSNEGLVRRYKQEYVAAGVPLWTASRNHNFYCPDCALTELSGGAETSPDAHDTAKHKSTEPE